MGLSCCWNVRYWSAAGFLPQLGEAIKFPFEPSKCSPNFSKIDILSIKRDVWFFISKGSLLVTESCSIQEKLLSGANGFWRVYLGEYWSWNASDQSEYRDVDAAGYDRRLGKAGGCLGVDWVNSMEKDGDLDWKESRSLPRRGCWWPWIWCRTGEEGIDRDFDGEARGKGSGNMDVSWFDEGDEGPADFQEVGETAGSIQVTTVA